MYEIYAKLRDANGVKDADVAKATGIGKSTFSDWKNGRSAPKDEKLQKIADYFGVSAYYLRTGKEPPKIIVRRRNLEKAVDIAQEAFRVDHIPPYYLNDDARDLAQFLFENPEYKILFDATRKVKKEDIQFVKALMDKMAGE